MQPFTESPERGLYKKPVFRVSREHSVHPVILVCEHASSYIPKELNALGLDPVAAKEHIAWDIGALKLAERLSQALGATLISAAYSRLLIDLNRPLGARDSIPPRSEIYDVPGNVELPEHVRQYRQEHLFTPFHQRLGELIDARLAAGLEVRVVAVHSFTPIYHGQPRTLEAGVLFDRAGDYAGRVLEGLAAHGLNVAPNQPYKVDVLGDMTVPFHGDQRGIDAILLEVRNDLLRTPQATQAWAERLAPLL
ncbi:MAG: hypothetical protein GAK37_03220 [Pseudomonas sp.]|nr:MAG: hypothetical protein GAK37_03220 [Pseudomonas sp.]